MKKILSILLIAALVAGCGIKRPLEVPGQKKHKTETQDTSATSAPPGDTSQQLTPADNAASAPQSK